MARDGGRGSRRGPMRGHGTAAVWSSSASVVAAGWRHARGPVVALAGVDAAAAAVPALQVLVVARLLAAGAAGIDASWPWLVALAGLVAAAQLVSELQHALWSVAGLRLHRWYQRELTRAIASFSPRELASPEAAGKVQVVRGSLSALGMQIGSVLNVVSGAVAAGGLCAAVWRYSPAAALMSVAALVPGVAVAAWAARRWDEVFRTYGPAERRSQYAVEQLVSERTGTELASLGSGGVVADIAAEQGRAADAPVLRLLGRLLAGQAAGGLAGGAVLGTALLALLAGRAGGAGVAAGLVGVVAALRATAAVGYAAGDIVASVPRVEAFRSLARRIAPRPGHQVSPRIDGAGLDGVWFTYPGGARPALADVSFAARRGEMVGLVGVNGAGKTTAVNVLMGLLDPDRGGVELDGRDAAGLGLPERLGGFGALGQDFGRYEFTVRDSLRIARPDGVATDAELWDALAAARLDAVIRALPLGLDAQLGAQFGGAGLSGGQWQRLALARIHLRGAGVWLLDEPTSAIDSEAEAEIFAELGASRTRRITLVVSHRAWTLKGMDRIHVFDDGRILESGSYPELVAAGGAFARLFDEQTA